MQPKLSKEEIIKKLEDLKNILSCIDSQFLINNQEKIKMLEEFDDYSTDFISLVLPIFFLGGENLLHNHKYREKNLSKKFMSFYTKTNKKGIHGSDGISIPAHECKSMSIKNKNVTLSLNTQIGQIDKVFNKLSINKNVTQGTTKKNIYSEDTDHHLVCGLFENTSANPIIAFSINNKDFGATIKPLLDSANKKYQESSKNGTQKSRDSLTLTIKDFINCDSFRVIFVNNNWVNKIIIKEDLKKTINAKNGEVKKSFQNFFSMFDNAFLNKIEENNFISSSKKEKKPKLIKDKSKNQGDLFQNSINDLDEEYKKISHLTKEEIFEKYGMGHPLLAKKMEEELGHKIQNVSEIDKLFFDSVKKINK